MSFISDIGKSIAGYMGGTVLEGDQKGKTAPQITAMLSGITRSTGKAAKLPALPKQKPLPVEVTKTSWKDQAKTFPNSLVVQREVEKERVASIEAKHQAAGRKKMGRETTDPAHLALFSGGPAPSPVSKKREQTDKKMVGVLTQLAQVLPGPLKAVGAGMAAGMALVKLPGMVQNMAMGRIQEQSGLARYNGRIARTLALMQVQDIHLGLRRARMSASSIESLGSATRDLRETTSPYAIAADVTKNVLAEAVTKITNEMVTKIEQVATFGNRDRFREAIGAGEDGEGLPFQTFLREMNPPVAQAGNQRVVVREGRHQRGA